MVVVNLSSAQLSPEHYNIFTCAKKKLDTNPTPGASPPNAHFLADRREPTGRTRSVQLRFQIFLHRQHRGVQCGDACAKKVGHGSCVGSAGAVCARLRLDRRADGASRRPPGARGAKSAAAASGEPLRPRVRRLQRVLGDDAAEFGQGLRVRRAACGETVISIASRAVSQHKFLL